MKLPITIRASKTDRVFTCGGSLLAEALIPVDRRDDGDEGEFIHYCTAEIAVRTLGALPPEGALKLPSLGKDYKLPAFSSWIIDWNVERIKELIPADWSLLVEVPLAYRYELPRPVWIPLDEIDGPVPDDHEIKDGMVCIRYVVISGHVDIMGLSPDGKRSICIDWKTGPVGAEPAESNWQEATYLGLKKLAWPDLEEATGVMAQPMVDEEATGIPRVSSVRASGERLERLNAELAERACRALENRYVTDSGPKQCRWCPVALSDRACLCPSLEADAKFMKANLTKDRITALRKAPDDGLLGDFVLTWKTLDAPGKAATELLHERLDVQGYVDAACGNRITRKIQKGDIEIVDKTGFRKDVEELLPIPEARDRCMSWSKDKLIKEIADARNIHQESKEGESAKGLWDDRLAKHTKQGERRILVIT